MKYYAALVLALISLQITTHPVTAISDPPLFSCENVIGQNIASYSTGTHGIPGSSATYIGQDTVYKIDDTFVLQCFCPEDNSSGIQSNWWKASTLSDAERDFFVRRGWILIPHGLAWGLTDAPYLVKNDTFNCGGTGGGGQNGSGIGGGGETASTTHSSNSPGSTLGVTSLAGTGNTPAIIGYFALSISAAYVAYRLSQV